MAKTNQQTNERDIQSVNQPACRQTNQLAKHPTNQPTNQTKK